MCTNTTIAAFAEAGYKANKSDTWTVLKAIAEAGYTDAGGTYNIFAVRAYNNKTAAGRTIKIEGAVVKNIVERNDAEMFAKLQHMLQIAFGTRLHNICMGVNEVLGIDKLCVKLHTL